MQNIIIYFISTAVSSGVPFILSLFLARDLPLVDSGLIALYLTQVSVAALMVGLGAYSSVQARYFIDSERFSSYLSACVAFHLIGWLILQAALLLVGDQASSFASLPLWAISAAVTAALLQCLVNMHLLLSQARGWSWRFLSIQVAQTLPLAILSPILAISF